MTTLVFSLARPNSPTQPTTHTEYPHTPTDGHALQVTEFAENTVHLTARDVHRLIKSDDG